MAGLCFPAAIENKMCFLKHKNIKQKKDASQKFTHTDVTEGKTTG
jgi:hypothetical protein